MDTSLAAAYLDLISGPILVLFILFAPTARCYPFFVRLGVLVASVGLMAQSYAVFAKLDQLNGLGTLWALKDLGLAIVALCILSRAVSKVLNKWYR